MSDVHGSEPPLPAAWRAIAGEPPSDVQALRHAILRRAAPELARRRGHARRRRFILPASLAASIALLFYAVPLPPASEPALARSQAREGAEPPLERLLDADVSERQFRALLFGATDADELLLIAAGDSGQRRDEAR